MAMGNVQTEADGSLPGLTIVAVSGEVDLAIAPVMDSQISAALGEASDIVVDLSDATFLDSVALWRADVGTRGLRRSWAQPLPRRQRPTCAPSIRTDGVDFSFAIFATRAELVGHRNQAGSTS